MSRPRFAGALSEARPSSTALAEAGARLVEALRGQAPDLVVAFATHHHGELLEELGPRLVEATGAGAVLGCTAESLIGGGRELEHHAGLALWAARLPGTRVAAFEVSSAAGARGPTFSALPTVRDPERSSVLLVADPYTFPMDAYLGELNERLTGVPAMGGMASGALGPGQTLLFTADGVRDSGCTGVLLEGATELVPVVSQGCRPVGTPWVITACEENRILELGGKPALDVLVKTFAELSPPDRELARGAAFLGLAVDPTRSAFAPDDFLVRGIMGLVQSEKSIAVSNLVRRGQTVQLLVRDAHSAGDELERMMGSADVFASADRTATGALVFSCNGRGSRMFEEPDHDVSRIEAGLGGGVPVVGFFAAGEVGPVGGRNFLHGFTASVAVFRERSA